MMSCHQFLVGMLRRVWLLAAKPADAQVFETLNATDLNNALKELMDGLSVKVFRTYNASITLDRLLFKESVSQTVDEKKADYDRANKEVCLSFLTFFGQCTSKLPLLRMKSSMLQFIYFTVILAAPQFQGVSIR